MLSWFLLHRAREQYTLNGTNILVGKSGSVGRNIMMSTFPAELAVAFAFGTGWLNDNFCRLFECCVQHM